MQKLLEIMERLRSPKGCPWDKEQDHQSIRMQLIEECYELVEAIDALDDGQMKEELGDVLLNVVFHAQLAKERGAFDFGDVVEEICEKLIRRHPHVFGEDKLSTSSQVLSRWHEIKKAEKPERISAIDGVPRHLPALMYSQKIQKKAARVGFDWEEIPPVLDKIREEIDELEETIRKKGAKRQVLMEEELGDLFFALVNLSRHLKIDAEQACRLATKKFSKRFRWVEDQMRKENVPMKGADLKTLDSYWERAKKAVQAEKRSPVKS